jgi:hypothetical protein
MGRAKEAATRADSNGWTRTRGAQESESRLGALDKASLRTRYPVVHPFGFNSAGPDALIGDRCLR